MAAPRRSTLGFGLLVAAQLLALACDSPPEDRREWQASDHLHEKSASGKPKQDQSSGQARVTMPGLDDVTVAAWTTKCVTCHGQVGRGDSMQGKMLKARDLTNPEWHKTVTDETIALTIKNGRGAMPAFKLPDSTIDGLVKLVRLLNRESDLWKKQGKTRGKAAAQGGDGGAANAGGGGGSAGAATPKPAAGGASGGAPGAAQPGPTPVKPTKSEGN